MKHPRYALVLAAGLLTGAAATSLLTPRHARAAEPAQSRGRLVQIGSRIINTDQVCEVHKAANIVTVTTTAAGKEAEINFVGNEPADAWKYYSGEATKP